MSESESIFIKCNCGGCSILEINSDKFDDEDLQFNVSLWIQHSGRSIFSKKERIRWCDNLMKTGKLWADHTIVTKKDAQSIIKFLSRKLTEYDKKRK
jgi:hypothetical protein